MPSRRVTDAQPSHCGNQARGAATGPARPRCWGADVARLKQKTSANCGAMLKTHATLTYSPEDEDSLHSLLRPVSVGEVCEVCTIKPSRHREAEDAVMAKAEAGSTRRRRGTEPTTSPLPTSCPARQGARPTFCTCVTADSRGQLCCLSSVFCQLLAELA